MSGQDDRSSVHAGLATTVVAVVRQHAVSVRATGLTQPSLGAGSRRGLMPGSFVVAQEQEIVLGGLQPNLYSLCGL